MKEEIKAFLEFLESEVKNDSISIYGVKTEKIKLTEAINKFDFIYDYYIMINKKQ